MIFIGNVLAGLIAAAIIFIGVRFLAAPGVAALGYGIPGVGAPEKGGTPWLSAKGLRDIVSGLFVVLLMVNSSARLLGEFLLVASLIPIGDAVIVLCSGGNRGSALGIHGSTALLIIASGLILLIAC